MKPLISIVVPAYNRAGTIIRTIHSILNQTYQNFEIIVVDDGSKDNIHEVLKQVSDERIRIFRHAVNRGVTAAKNTGLDQIRGEWFTTIDSDDEILPDALETMIKIPLEIDSSITAVTCNCFDTTTQQFSGKGLDHEQFIDEEIILKHCDGDFWGITRTDLLGKDRFNENVPGYEGILWFKINAKAKRYYIHRALLIYHTEGSDRLTKRKNDLSIKSRVYKAIKTESDFLDKFKLYTPKRYVKYCLAGVVYQSAVGENDDAKYWTRELKQVSLKYYILSLMVIFLPSQVVKMLVETFH